MKDDSTRHGDWTQTFTGRKFWPLDVRAGDICIEDIAHALSMICRFGGHCFKFYSVAEHSVRVSHVAEEKTAQTAMATPERIRSVALRALLHDAAEAYIGDMVRPLKRQPEMNTFRMIEVEIEEAVTTALGLSYYGREIVKWADEVMLATEIRDLAGGERAGKFGYPQAAQALPLAHPIVPMDPASAKGAFLARYEAIRAAQ